MANDARTVALRVAARIGIDGATVTILPGGAEGHVKFQVALGTDDLWTTIQELIILDSVAITLRAAIAQRLSAVLKAMEELANG